MKNLIAITDKDLEMVSGGLLKPTESGISSICDNCGHVSHISVDVNKLKEILGEEFINTYLKGE